MAKQPHPSMLSKFTFEDAESIYEEVMTLVLHLSVESSIQEKNSIMEEISISLRGLYGFTESPEA